MCPVFAKQRTRHVQARIHKAKQGGIPAANTVFLAPAGHEWQPAIHVGLVLVSVRHAAGQHDTGAHAGVVAYTHRYACVSVIHGKFADFVLL